VDSHEQQTGKLSVTALGACVYRAIGARDPDEETRNPDYLAEKFIDRLPIVPRMGLSLDFAEAIDRIRRTPRYLYFFVTARTKHLDAVLTRELESGAAQVVILGAGFDSRALRFHQKFPHVKFFEPDRPATQEIKRRLTRARIGPPPSTLVYVPLDFNTQSLGQALGRAGYDPRARTVFIWEGVTYYLSAEAVDATLRFIAEHSAPGSAVVFDYLDEDLEKAGGERSPEVEKVRKRLADQNEPLAFGLPQKRAASFVARRGLRVEPDLGPEELTRRYLIAGDGSVYGPVPRSLRIMQAVVPDRQVQP